MRAKTVGPDKHPFAQFNRNQTGLNPDWQWECSHTPIMDQLLTDEQRDDFDKPLYVTEEVYGLTHSILLINWKNMNQDMTPIVVLLQFSVTTDEPKTTPYMLEQIVKLADGRPVVVINSPGMNGSSKMPRRYRGYARWGDFSYWASSILYMLRDLKVQEFDVVGFSMGGRMALAIAQAVPSIDPHLERWDRMHVESVVAVESPGFKKFGRLAFIRRFAGKEGEQLKYYQQTTRDAGLKIAIGPPVSMLQQSKAFLKALSGDRLGNLALFNGLRHATAAVDTRSIFGKRSTVHVTLIHATSSYVAPYAHVDGASLRLLPGDTHSFGEEGRRVAWHIMDALDAQHRRATP